MITIVGGDVMMTSSDVKGPDKMEIKEKEVLVVRISRLKINAVYIDVTDARVMVDDVTMTHINWTSRNYVDFRATNSKLNGRVGGDMLNMSAKHLVFRAHNFTVAQDMVNLNAGSVLLSVRNSTFSNVAGQTHTCGGLNIIVTEKNYVSAIEITDSRFEHQYFDDPIMGVRNLMDAALKINVFDHAGHVTAIVSVFIQRSMFVDNERGLALFGLYNSIRIFSCTFDNNIAMHAGAGILVFTRKESNLAEIVDCTFLRNAAGAIRPAIIRNYSETFVVKAHEVTINSECCKGVISLVGKGGALRLQRGNASLKDCIFRDNTARLLGGAVFVDRDGELTIDGMDGKNSESLDVEHPLEGELLYSNGIVHVKSARLEALTASSHVPILCHSGAVWSIDVIKIELVCPLGYRLRVTNTSAYKIENIGIRKSYKLDQLSYFCESCPRNKYSLDYGFLNHSLQFNAISYFTLLINGQVPTPAYTGMYAYHDIDCQQCPYGGKCLHSITAVPNFWGYKTNADGVRFQRCQKGYCCSDLDCKGFNSCKKHRVGTLCGECEAGYSEAMFTADCVPNANCDPMMGWPVVASSCILYFVFLLFQKDMRDLMFSQIVRASNARPAHQASVKKCETQRRDQIRDVLLSNEENDSLVRHRSDSRKHTAELMSDDLNSSTRLHSRMLDESNICGDTIVDGEEIYPSLEVPLEFLDTSSPPPPPPPPQQTQAQVSNMGVSFLIIIFFYFQDAQLLHIKTAFTSADGQYKAMFRELLSGLFQFRVELFQFMEKFCFLADMTALKKIIVRVGMVPCVLIQFGIVHLIHKLFCRNRRGSDDENAQRPGDAPTFSVKLATGFVLALLFTYQQLATTSFTLLNCVTIEQRSVLFVQGTIDCYQTWQYGVMAYAGSCIVPFCLVILIGPGLLKDDLIGLMELFVAFILPFPFLIRWVWIRFRVFGDKQVAGSVRTLSAESKSVMQILQGPFKDQHSR